MPDGARIRSLALLGPAPDSVVGPLVEATGAQVCRTRDEPVDALVLVDAGDGESWLTLDRWRIEGERAPVVVVAESGPNPGNRAALEPVTHLRPPLRADAVALALDGLTRRTPPTRARLPAGELRYDQSQLARADGSTVKLTARELDLLAYFLARPFTDVSRDELQVQVWGHVKPSPGRAVDMAISRLRKKIEVDPAQPTVLVSARGDGYRLHLPLPPTVASGPGAFVGRDAALDALAVARASSRLVQVLGAPGVGKSRLVRESLVDAEGPVAWVSLARCPDEDAVLEAVAGQLGFDLGSAPDPRRARELVRRQLALRGTLHLVLDGVDRVVEPVAALASEWLQGSAALQLTLTSRRRLPLAEAAVVDVEPLDLDASRALFTARARAAGWTGEPDVVGLTAILLQLDGLPLALELAAARMRSRTVAELARGLEDRFQLLRQRGGDSLDASLALSWDRLDTSEQTALSTLAHVPGALPRDLAEALTGDDLALDELVDASLLHPDPERGTTWMVLLDSVRAYARAQRPDPGPLLHRLDHAATWATRARSALRGAQGIPAAARLARVAPALRHLWRLAAHANHPAQTPLVEAIDTHHEIHVSLEERRRFLEQAWAVAGPDARPLLALQRARTLLETDRSADVDADLALARTDPELAARADVLTAQRFKWHGRLDDGRQLLEPWLEVPDLPTSTRASIQLYVGLATHMAHGAVAPSLLDELTTLADDLVAADNLDLASSCLHLLGVVHGNRGALDAAVAVMERMATLTAQLPRTPVRLRGIELRAWLHSSRGEHEQALELADSVIRRLRASGYDSRARYFRQHAAEAALHLGLHDRVRTELALATAEAAGRDLAHAQEILALVHLDRGEPEQARTLLEEALDHASDGGDAILLGFLAMHHATAWLMLGDADTAVRLFREIDPDLFPARHRADLLVRRWAAHQRLGDEARADRLRGELGRLAADPTVVAREELEDWLAGRPSSSPSVQRRLWDRLAP